jgi:hypothetical protein
LKRRATVALGAVLALLAVSCGGGDSDDAATPTAVTAPATEAPVPADVTDSATAEPDGEVPPPEGAPEAAARAWIAEMAPMDSAVAATFVYDGTG